MSPAQLNWTHKRHQRRQVEREIRFVLNMTSAAHTGASGGSAAESRIRDLKRELRALGNDVADGLQKGPQSQTPLNREQFWHMYEEEKSL